MPSEYDQLTYRARVLCSMTRIEIYSCIGEIGMYPSDIAGTLGLAPSTVTHHLTVLRDAGLVEVEQQGRNRLYRTTDVRWGVVSEAEVIEMMASTGEADDSARP